MGVAPRLGAAAGADPAARATPRGDFLSAFAAFLGHFSEIEDVRFKVKGATFDEDARAVPGAEAPTAAPGAAGAPTIAFFVWGRDGEGRREWARGTAEARVRKPASGPWQFSSFKVTKLDSQLAAVDLFSEVAVPAGVGATLPAYGEPPNSGFTWHGAAASDWNGDGWLDVFVTGPERNWLYLNDGNGRFRDASEESGILCRGERGGPAGARLRQRRRHGHLPRHRRRAGPPREPPGARRDARLPRRLAGGGRRRARDRLQRRRRPT